MLKTLCVLVLALAASSPPVQAQLDGSIVAGKAYCDRYQTDVLVDLSFHYMLLHAGVTSQVESFWTELFNGGAYSSGFLSSLRTSDDQQHKLKIPETGRPLVHLHSFVRYALIKPYRSTYQHSALVQT